MNISVFLIIRHVYYSIINHLLVIYGSIMILETLEYTTALKIFLELKSV